MTASPASSSIVQQAVVHAQAGEFAAAREALIAALRQRPDDPDAWFWLACVTENPWEALTSLRKVRELAPRRGAEIERGLAWAQERIDAGQRLTPMQAPYAPRPAEAGHKWTRPWALGLLTTALLLIVAGLGLWLAVFNGFDGNDGPFGAPVLAAEGEAVTSAPSPSREGSWESDWSAGNWAGVITKLESLSAKGALKAGGRDRLFEAHVRYGDARAERGDLDGALAQYDAAMALRPYDAEAQRKRGLLARYLIGLKAFQASEWERVPRALLPLYQEAGDYRGTRQLLSQAHYNLGLARQAAGRLEEAENEYHRALQFDEGAAQIESKLLQIAALRATPTPAPAPKRIEVSIAEQRFYAYEGDRLVYDFICSTGMWSSPTAPGHYKILDKMPMAYASTWGLDMPFWMGIYWSGNLENGIHALPILANGQVLWEGFLGQPASYGCIILSTEDAEIIYNWAEVGTPVIIY